MNEEIEWFLSLPTDAAEAVPALPPTTPAPAPAPMAEDLLFEASRRITLRCGKSSITLYPNGKIALRGQYILSDAEGVNRIVGGQIDLN